MKHKTKELEGAKLDAAVAMAEGEDPAKVRSLQYSKSWRDAGKIIERERIVIMPRPNGKAAAFIPDRWSVSGEPVPIAMWGNHITGAVTTEYVQGPVEIAIKTAGVYLGPTPLIAAMRCYVASKFGPEVELP